MLGEALVRKFQNVAKLSNDDLAIIGWLSASRRNVKRYFDIILAGSEPTHVHCMVEGWAARYSMLPDGNRQITAFLLPGDFCDLHGTILGTMDHGIVALTDCSVAFIGANTIAETTSRSATLMRAFWWQTLVDEAVLRQWIVNNGRRDAHAAVAHLLCELHQRMAMIGRVANDRFELPMTQQDLADALGLTSVHSNRVLQGLRGDGMITLRSRTLVINDLDGLRELAGFNPTYLHIRPL